MLKNIVTVSFGLVMAIVIMFIQVCRIIYQAIYYAVISVCVLLLGFTIGVAHRFGAITDEQEERYEKRIEAIIEKLCKNLD